MSVKEVASVKKACLLMTAFLWAGCLGVINHWLLAGSQEGYVVERDAEVAKNEPGPHQGTGQSTGFVFFEKVPEFKLFFRKRILHPGASIGYHPQNGDEIYYIIEGTGLMTINGKALPVRNGDAILTRTGSSHGLTQTGNKDLVIIITYEK
jgi:mannose-6-phosphate isomerase-like protein (cupin superfamily)